MTSRREFLETAALSAAGLSLRKGAQAGEQQIPPVDRDDNEDASAEARGFLDLRRTPDLIAAQTDAGETELPRETDGRWSRAGVQVTTAAHNGALRVSLSSPSVAVKRLHLRWRGDLSSV